MGDEALGVISAYFYSAALDTPANRTFSAAYTKATGRIPSLYSSYPYTAGRWIVEAVKAVGGDVENKDRFLAALKSVDIQDDVRGPIKVDPYGNPILNIYIRKVERVGGRLQNSVIYTYPAVGQFWTYKPEEFLKNPVYDRDKFPGCQHCE
jgi:branched-chain amino acid transport system substrate-binding protein